jgi:hypothetical protein
VTDILSAPCQDRSAIARRNQTPAVQSFYLRATSSVRRVAIILPNIILPCPPSFAGSFARYQSRLCGLFVLCAFCDCLRVARGRALFSLTLWLLRWSTIERSGYRSNTGKMPVIRKDGRATSPPS